MSKSIIHQINIQEAFPPFDLQTARTGDYVSLANYHGCLCVFQSAVGTAGDDPIVTFTQATDNGGTGAKALNIPSQRCLMKMAATNLTGTGTWSDASAYITANVWDENSVSAEQDLILVVDFLAEDLDVDNGFDHLRFAVGDTGTNAQLGVGMYILHHPRFAEDTGISPL